MERNTQIWIGVVVLAALGGAVYYKAKEDQKIGTSQTTSADLPDLATPADADKLENQPTPTKRRSSSRRRTTSGSS